MRKLIYLPAHVRDRLLKFRQRHEMMDEQVALIRLVDAGLKVEEDKYLAEKTTANGETTSSRDMNFITQDPRVLWPWNIWGRFYR